jgi:hypothetical protein
VNCNCGVGVTCMVKKTMVVERFNFRPLIKCKHNETGEAKHYASNSYNSLESLHVQGLNPTNKE